MVPFDRVTFDPQIMGGRACIRGMRIPVSVIVGRTSAWRDDARNPGRLSRVGACRHRTGPSIRRMAHARAGGRRLGESHAIPLRHGCLARSSAWLRIQGHECSHLGEERLRFECVGLVGDVTYRDIREPFLPQV